MKHAPYGAWIFVFVEVRMIKKMLWLVILVLIAACSIYVNDGILTIDPSQTAIATDCADCTVIPTAGEGTEIPVDATATTEVIPSAESTVEVTATIAETTTVEATATLAATEAPTETALPSSTATPTFTATAIPPTATPTLTATEIPMTFAVQTGSPVYMVNFVRTSAGCNWSGIAGQVFDSEGKPLTGYIIKVTGTYNSTAVNSLAVTGMVTGTPYGPASYEVVLGTKALASTDLLSIQLFDPGGNVLTTPLRFSTYTDCSKNLVIINFKQK
jgi:hypothetical protein